MGFGKPFRQLAGHFRELCGAGHKTFNFAETRHFAFFSVDIDRTSKSPLVGHNSKVHMCVQVDLIENTILVAYGMASGWTSDLFRAFDNVQMRNN